MAERTQFAAYLGYSALLTGFVYPTVVHWAWGSGWLSSVPWKKDDGDKSLAYHDFAGSGVVHMVGGFAGLMGAIMVGPRTGRFDAQGRPIAMPGHNAALVVLGTFILWVGWYGFNCGSQARATTAADAVVIGRVGITTTLAASAGGVTSLFLNYALYKVWDLIAVCNGVLAGLVSITAGCSVLDLYMAVFAGFIGAFVLFGASKLLLKLRIDDPLEAFPVHGACGMWGVLAVGLFAKEKYLGDNDNDRYGALMGGNGRLFGVQLLGAVCHHPLDVRHPRPLLLRFEAGWSPPHLRGRGGCRPRRVQARRLRVQQRVRARRRSDHFFSARRIGARDDKVFFQ